jgi:hypothetical protein
MPEASGVETCMLRPASNSVAPTSNITLTVKGVVPVTGMVGNPVAGSAIYTVTVPKAVDAIASTAPRTTTRTERIRNVLLMIFLLHQGGVIGYPRS